MIVQGLPKAYVLATQGHLAELNAWLDSLDPSARAWRNAGQMIGWLARPELWSRPALPPDDEQDDDALAESLQHHFRVCLLELDVVAARRVTERLELLKSPRAQAWAKLARGHLFALAGDGGNALRLATEVYVGASEAGAPALVVEAILLRSAAHMADGAVDSAVADARRASRMAQTEHLWLTHYATCLLLARLRRLSGRPHLAGLIVTQCLAVTSSIFHAWLRWEHLFACGEDLPPEFVGGQESVLTRASGYVSRCLQDGRVSEEMRGALRTLIAESGPHRSDVDALMSVLSPTHEPAGPPELLAWRGGLETTPPACLSGLVTLRPDAPTVVVAASPHHPSRRILSHAVPEAFVRVGTHGGRAARPEALASALALAGPEGEELGEVFLRVYGFPFRKTLHEPSYKVVRHHTRTMLKGVAEMWTRDERVGLIVEQPFVIEDPRCVESLPGAMLRFLAVGRELGTKDLARELEVSIRSVQRAIRELTSDGACVEVKEGRKVYYSVEDTTFCTITVA